MSEKILIVATAIGMAIGLIALVVLGVYLTDKYIATPNFGRSVQKPVKYNFWAGGCFVRLDNGQWINCDNYQGVNIEK